MKNTKNIRFHQGDVQGKTITSLPKNCKRIDNQPLAYGEISGHVHVLTGDVELYEDDKRRFAKVGTRGARLQHILQGNLKSADYMTEVKELPVADHKSILFAPGIYEFGIQKQYDPYENVLRPVID